MALSKSALKAKFVTGAIPTQTDFANLIDGMLSMPLGKKLVIQQQVSEMEIVPIDYMLNLLDIFMIIIEVIF